ncbi:MAG: beta-lactamase class [Acidobacteria bacterium]|nr:beta-lactamase class [Acidobacteriota bacterium]
MKALIALLLLAVSTSTLTQQIAAIAAKAPATIGVAALDLDRGRRVSIRGDERFPMGSVFKVPVALAFLRRVDAGEFKLGEKVTIPVSSFAPGFSPIRDKAKGQPVTMTYGEILAAMLRDSDNTAADFLLPKAGGGAEVTKRLRELGVNGIRVDRSEREMAADLAKKGGVARFALDPRDTATPNAVIELLRRFEARADRLSPASHALAMKLMADSGTGPNRIKSSLPPGTVFAHKTGTMPGTVNDVGIIVKERILIAVFTKAGTTEDLAPREKAIAEVGRAVYAAFAK